ncbi:MAG: hypothetical protein KGQ36_03260 [Rickettsiales bacterium]|nr:hypothetical protein [Rickettsiales bacterium]
MPRVFDSGGNIPNLDEVSCGIYIGRMQPLLRTHFGCIKQITGADQKREILLLIGSTNSYDQFFLPLENPLTVDQRKQQLELALINKNIKYKIDFLPDLGDQDKWVESIKERVLANGFDPKKSAYCYFKKEEEYKKSPKAKVKPLDSYSQKIQENDINIWRLRNIDSMLDNISATPFRSIDLFSENKEIQKKITDNLVVPEFIKNLVIQAREKNHSAALLDELQIPKTMLDLSLNRLQEEAGISTKSLFDKINLKQEPQALYNGLSRALYHLES